jgi:hypothetical protein
LRTTVSPGDTFGSTTVGLGLGLGAGAGAVVRWCVRVRAGLARFDGCVAVLDTGGADEVEGDADVTTSAPEPSGRSETAEVHPASRIARTTATTRTHTPSHVEFTA